MTLAAVEAGEASGTTSTATLTVTVDVNCDAGDILAVCIAADNAGSGGAASIYAVSDSKGNEYPDRTSLIKNKSNASNANDSGTCAVFISVLATALVGGVDTVTLSFSPDTYAKACVLWKVTSGTDSYEFPSPKTADGYGTTAAWSGFSVAANDMIIGVAAMETDDSTIGRDTDTQHGTWSNPIHSKTADRGSRTSSQTVSSQWKVPTTTGTQQYANTTDDACDWETIGYVIREGTYITATFAAPLGAIVGTINADVTVEPTVQATLAALLGTITGTITATVEVPVGAVLAAPLGTITGTMNADVIAAPTVDAVLAAPLGTLAAAANADVSAAATVVQATLTAPFGALTGRIAAVIAGIGSESIGAITETHRSTGTFTLLG